MEKYDLVVIGSGPAGFSAAMRALDFGKSVCIVEKNELGGAGLMHGALTSKTMWEIAHNYSIANSTRRGYRAASVSVEYKEVVRLAKHAAKKKQNIMLSQIETYSPERSQSGTVTLKYGHARFLNKTTVEIELSKNKHEKIQGNDFIIATGSRPRTLSGIEVDKNRIIDSNGILNLKEFPQRMLIIGSGIIGCEFATIFSNFGKTEVHLLDRQHRVIPFEDDDISDFVSKNLEKNGVVVHHTANLRAIRKQDDCLEVVLDYKDGHSKVLEVDIALVAVGRIPNTDDLGLENVEVGTNERGFLQINETCMIKNNPNRCHIFAAGDITGHGQLYNVAENQGRYATRGIYENAIFPADYSTMSTLMFFEPLMASVGMNEKQLQQQKIPYKMSYYSNELVNRALAMGSTNGFVKLLISDNNDERILGMRAAGEQASSYIISIAHLINQGNSINEVMKVIYPHPSITEGVKEALRVFHSKSVLKPRAFPEYIKLKKWTPE